MIVGIINNITRFTGIIVAEISPASWLVSLFPFLSFSSFIPLKTPPKSQYRENRKYKNQAKPSTTSLTTPSSSIIVLIINQQ